MLGLGLGLVYKRNFSFSPGLDKEETFPVHFIVADLNLIINN